MAERAGQSAVALRAYHDAVRLGDIRAVDPLARLCDEIDCAVGRIALAHARALAPVTTRRCGRCRDELAAVGMRAAAADAAAQAQRFEADNQRANGHAVLCVNRNPAVLAQ